MQCIVLYIVLYTDMKIVYMIVAKNIMRVLLKIRMMMMMMMVMLTTIMMMTMMIWHWEMWLIFCVWVSAWEQIRLLQNDPLFQYWSRFSLYCALLILLLCAAVQFVQILLVLFSTALMCLNSTWFFTELQLSIQCNSLLLLQCVVRNNEVTFQRSSYSSFLVDIRYVCKRLVQFFNTQSELWEGGEGTWLQCMMILTMYDHNVKW